MRESLRKYIGLLTVGFIMALGTTVSIILLFNEFLPINSVAEFVGATLIFTIVYAELGYALEFILTMPKEAQN